MSREQKVAVVESYLGSFATKDLSSPTGISSNGLRLEFLGSGASGSPNATVTQAPVALSEISLHCRIGENFWQTPNYVT